MSKFRKFLNRISSETCLKMDYFGNKSPKIAKAGVWGEPPDPLSSGGWRL